MRYRFSCVVVTTSLLVAMTQLSNAFPPNPFNRSNCTYQGKKLYGKVQIVDSLADIRVKIVSDFSEVADLRVLPVTAFPQQCGEWQFVESFPDLKIQIVTNSPDLQIQLVDEFPGRPRSRF